MELSERIYKFLSELKDYDVYIDYNNVGRVDQIIEIRLWDNHRDPSKEKYYCGNTLDQTFEMLLKDRESI